MKFASSQFRSGPSATPPTLPGNSMARISVVGRRPPISVVGRRPPVAPAALHPRRRVGLQERQRPAFSVVELAPQPSLHYGGSRPCKGSQGVIDAIATITETRVAARAAEEEKINASSTLSLCRLRKQRYISHGVGVRRIQFAFISTSKDTLGISRPLERKWNSAADRTRNATTHPPAETTNRVAKASQQKALVIFSDHA